MTSLPPIAELLCHDPESRFRHNLALVGTASTLSHLRYYTDEVLVREFSQMEKNRGALEQRRLVGLETLQIASLDPGPSLDLIIRAAILGSPSRRLRLIDIQRAIRIWSGASLTTVIRNAIYNQLTTGSELFAWQPLRPHQHRHDQHVPGGWWIVVAEPPLRVAPRPPLPPCHVPLPGFDEAPRYGDLFPSPRDAWAGPSNPRFT
ncbi:hypothetical protein JB92DRAFT_3062848 [Gautieria morchelliformis]|nr:hypothetical protein JB92DRAFT_3062848 [Gautieria morchelliformis]